MASKRVSSGKDVASRSVPAPAPHPTLSPPGEALRQRKYRELIRKHLGRLLDKIFAEFTGLHFHVSWAPLPPHEWDVQTLPTGCSVCCRLSGFPLRPGCQTCGPRQLVHTLSADGEGHRFTCLLGVRNYWFALRIRGETVGIAYLQAFDGNSGKHPARKNSLCAGARVSSQLEFARAARLLRFTSQHAQTASLADLRKADLTSAGRAILALEKEQARLHETLDRLLPAAPQTLHRPGTESHAEQLVHRLLERIELEYARPITLQHYARELGLNAAYLSDLFSHVLGVPFKTCLTGVRMAKAKALLELPANHISAVAYAVGYASENRFRAAFKKATGLSPKLWRETMQTNPPPASP